MYPELFHFDIFGFHQSIYTYAFCIVAGTLVAAKYTKWRAKKEMNDLILPNSFFYTIFIAGFVGGKLFYYLERPLFFMQHPEQLLHNFSGGFVFYGSFITIIPVIILFVRRHHILLLPLLDILAFTTLIVHSIGRLGCFFGGCCYGKPTDSVFGIAFPQTNGINVHPTQLYEIVAIIIIGLVLLYIKKNQKFKGQIFLLYIIFYAIVRSIIELFRGDARGFIIDGSISHAQFIAFIITSTGLLIYYKLKLKNI